jgi:hypothetical protein
LYDTITDTDCPDCAPIAGRLISKLSAGPGEFTADSTAFSSWPSWPAWPTYSRWWRPLCSAALLRRCYQRQAPSVRFRLLQIPSPCAKHTPVCLRIRLRGPARTSVHFQGIGGARRGGEETLAGVEVGLRSNARARVCVCMCVCVCVCVVNRER